MRDKNNKKALTLAEMMAVLMVLGIIVAAVLPVTTQRKKSADATAEVARYKLPGYWKKADPADKNSSIYYGLGDTQGVAIGAEGLGGINTRLLINTSSADQNFFSFYALEKNQGGLRLDNSQNIGFGIDALTGGNCSHCTAIGGRAMNTFQGKDNTAIGVETLKSGSGDFNTAVGYRTFMDLKGSNNTGLNAPVNAPNGYSYDNNTLFGLDDNLFYHFDIKNNTAIVIRNLNFLNFLKSNSTVIMGDTYIPYQSENATILGPSSGYSAIGNALNSTLVGGSVHTQDGAVGLSTLGLKQSCPQKSYSTTIGYSPSYEPLYDYGLYLGHKPGLVYPNYVIFPGTLKLGTLNGALIGDLYGPFIVTSSDRRLKNIGGEFDGGLEQIAKLQPYNYVFKKAKDKTPKVGVMAQDLQEVFPDAVTKGEGGYFMIRKEDMFYAMINSLKQLDIMVQKLSKQLKVVVAKARSLDDRIIALIRVDEVKVKKISRLKEQNKSIEARLQRLESTQGKS